ncbi:MAG: glycosyltransferase [Planctomycetota bacterium]|jgi:glycosyltransferase involved in cell wall biosynthesis/GT2 family glycosyltransferase
MNAEMGRSDGVQRADFAPLPVQATLRGERSARVCIVSEEVVGPHRCGGIGTHYTTLAQTLSRAGHDVTVLYARGERSDDRTIEHWVGHYREQGISLVPLRAPGVRLRAAPGVARSYAVYLWLRNRVEPFDVIHFPERCGFGYYALLAKRQGLHFSDSAICVGTHGPLLWIAEAHGWRLREVDDLAMGFQERRCVQLADIVVSPSRYMLGWMQRQGWQLPPETFVQPYILPGTARRGSEASGAQGANGERSDIGEFVFFGRLEDRKGLVPFCDALDILAESGAAGFRVTFLGRPHMVQGEKATDYLSRRGRRWPFLWQILGDRNQAQAMEYISGPSRLAVIASLTDNLPHTVLECLGAGIPFVASRVGGIPEMVADEDKDAVLFPLWAEALAERLQRALDEGVGTARPAVDFDANERAWVAWHGGLARDSSDRAGAKSPMEADAAPAVSVCLTDMDDSDWRARAVAAVRQQDYGNVEVVTVDAQGLGAGNARNEAARQAKGEYLLFLGQGDLPRPDTLSALVGVAARTAADIVTCCVDFTESGSERGGASPVEERWVPLGPSLAVGVFEDCFGGPSMLVRRDQLLSVGGFAEDYGAGVGDREFYLKALLAGLRHELVPEPLIACSRGPMRDASASEAYADDLRSVRPFVSALPEGLHELAGLSQGLELIARETTAALNECRRERYILRRERDLALKGRRHAVRRWRRYRSAYRGLMDKPPLRAYRAVKRALLSLLGRGNKPGEEQPGS